MSWAGLVIAGLLAIASVVQIALAIRDGNIARANNALLLLLLAVVIAPRMIAKEKP